MAETVYPIWEPEFHIIVVPKGSIARIAADYAYQPFSPPRSRPDMLTLGAISHGSGHLTYGLSDDDGWENYYT